MFGVIALATAWSVAERHRPEAAVERAEAVAIGFVRREADDGRRAAVKIVIRDDDFGAILRDVLEAVAPASRRLDGGFDRLGAGVHRQRHVEAGDLDEALQERPEQLGVIGAAGDREPAGLLHHGLQDARMPVAEADGRIGAHHVEIAPAVRVGHPDALRLRKTTGSES